MSTATEYRDLLVQFAPRPIQSPADYRRTVAQLERIMEPHPSAARSQLIEVLATLIERYDAENAEKLPVSSGLDLLKYLVAEHDLGGDGLAKILEVDRSVAYRILKGERSLTTTHVKTLGAHFGVSAHVFLG